MSKILYLDMLSGASGDMLCGAAIDAGVPFKVLQDAVAALNLPDLKVSRKKVSKCGIGATQFTVLDTSRPKGKQQADHHHHHDHGHHHHPHRGMKEIRAILRKSNLAPRVKKQCTAVFECLGKAEAKVHRTTLEKIHFHEVGALDAIADVVCAVVAFDHLNADEIIASPFLLGSGHVHCAHGSMPVPVPATLEIIHALPSVRQDTGKEMTTPTGAALVATLADSFSVDVPSLCPVSIGYGAGQRNLEGRANVLRLIVSEAVSESTAMMELQCTIDDMNPQWLECALDAVVTSGGVDPFVHTVMAKKQRQGLVISCLCPRDKMGSVEAALFEHTTTLGVRRMPVERTVLSRRFKRKQFKGHTIRIKEGLLAGKVVNRHPEYEDCKKAAEALGVSLKVIYEGLLG